ncbi:MAG: radical SAM protein [Deltaproteobacteria bacterium]|nr:radical SAM protein [Deltaproteobacteria bacterium]
MNELQQHKTANGSFNGPIARCVWELTLRCNALCCFCGSRAGTARAGEFDTKRCLDLAREMIDLGLEKLTLSGGEPLLSKSFFEIAKFTIARGVRADTVTNGLMIDENMAGRIADLGLSAISISLDGPEEIHDRLRGVPGSYRKVMRGAEFLDKRGVRVGTITHVNKINFPHMDRLFEDLKQSAFKIWKVQLTIPETGCADSFRERVTAEQLPAVADLIRRVQADGRLHCAGGHNIGYFGCEELTLRTRSKDGPTAWGGCAAGRRVLGMTSNGGVLGCLSLLTHDERFIEGYVTDRSLTEIWRDPNSFAYNRQFRPEQRSGFCGACRFLERCRGGCINQLAALDPEMKDNPLCLYRVESSQRPPHRTSVRRPPSAVYVVVDGLRPDYIGPGLTPNLHRLMQDGMVMNNARSSAVWTMPAVGSMLTGMAAHRLGAIKWASSWRNAKTDLFTFLANQGYATASFPFFPKRDVFARAAGAR